MKDPNETIADVETCRKRPRLLNHELNAQGPSNPNGKGLISGRDQLVPGTESNSDKCIPIIEPRKVPLFLGNSNREQDQTHPDTPTQGEKGPELANLGAKCKAREEWSGQMSERVGSRRGELSQNPCDNSEIKCENQIKGNPSAESGLVCNQVYKPQSSQSPEEKSIPEQDQWALPDQGIILES